MEIKLYLLVLVFVELIQLQVIVMVVQELMTKKNCGKMKIPKINGKKKI